MLVRLEDQGRAAESLRVVEQQFARWRKSRGGSGRVPNELWRAAAEAARVHGARETAAQLQLDLARLQQWMRDVGKPSKSAPQPRKTPQFVELTPLALAGASECTLEIEEPSGRKLRVTLKGHCTAQAAELGQLLWRGEP